jgi:hypothetical protein
MYIHISIYIYIYMYIGEIDETCLKELWAEALLSRKNKNRDTNINDRKGEIHANYHYILYPFTPALLVRSVCFMSYREQILQHLL